MELFWDSSQRSTFPFTISNEADPVRKYFLSDLEESWKKSSSQQDGSEIKKQFSQNCEAMQHKYMQLKALFLDQLRQSTNDDEIIPLSTPFKAEFLYSSLLSEKAEGDEYTITLAMALIDSFVLKLRNLKKK